MSGDLSDAEIEVMIGRHDRAGPRYGRTHRALRQLRRERDAARQALEPFVEAAAGTVFQRSLSGYSHVGLNADTRVCSVPMTAFVAARAALGKDPT